MTDTLTTQSATPATIPASSIIATDDAGAAGHVQVIKLAVSTDGSATPLTANNTDGLFVGGSLTETAPTTDTASSGLNGRLQRIAQRITSLITALGSPFQAGGSIGNTTFAATQSGTWDEVGINDSGNSITIDNAQLSVVGTGTEAAAMRVTIATDSTGVLSVDDNGGALTVDNAGTFATQVDGAALTALQLIDNVVVVEDAAAAGGESGVQMLGVRKDTGGTLASTDGDFTPAQFDSSGNLRVNVAAGAAAGTEYTEDAAAAADPVGTSLMLVRKDTPASDVTTDGDNIAARGNSAGAQYVELLSGTAKVGGDATNGLDVDVTRLPALVAGTANIGDVDVLTIAAGDNNIGNVDVVTMPTVVVTLAAGATAIAKAEDVASADADVGVPAMAVRKATPANVSGTDGDYEFLQVSAGRLWASATIDAALPAGTNGIGKLTANTGVTIGAVEIAAAQTLATVTTVSTVTAVTTLTGGGVAHDGADSGNPVKVGAKAVATPSTATMVAAADRVDATADLDSALFVRHVLLGDIITEAITNTDGASTATTNFAATASARNYITALTVFRTDAATTMAYIDFRDGTAGAVLYRVPLPPAGGAVLSNGGEPLFYTTANTALAFDVSAALTSVYISLTGFKSKARA